MLRTLKSSQEAPSGKKNVVVGEHFPDLKQFIHDVKHLRREGASPDTEIFRLKNLVTEVSREASDDDQESVRCVLIRMGRIIRSFYLHFVLMTGIRTARVNVNGAREHGKRVRSFESLKRKRTDVATLQETRRCQQCH